VNHFWVGASSAAAKAQWEPRYRAYIEWVNALVFESTGGRSRGLGGFDFEDRLRTTAICGSPAEVVDRIGQLRDVLHLDTMLLMFDMGGVPDDELAAAIELAGADVLPHLEPSRG
jgi:alkanesulfonate monooxygenase SsuD/methylene tetrahydromethanopterin reductase-like flavin-dependent oxidoreductase (luciferase family)